MRRRNFFLGVAAIGFTASHAVAASSDRGAEGLSVTLSFLSTDTTLTFEQSKAHDIGDYNGEFVHQKCYVQRQDVWTVFFRPDADGSRNEIVVERGNKIARGDDLLDPYTATIKKGLSVLTTIEVPFHFWMSRWRWQSSPRPVVRTPAQLVKAKLILPFTNALLYGHPAWTGLGGTTIVPVYSGPMDTTRINFGGGTGERDDIGLVTEPCAQYILNESAAALQTILAQAEGTASFPLHWRDPNTDALINWLSYPGAEKIQGSGLIPMSFPRCPLSNGKGAPPPAPQLRDAPGGALKERTYWVQITYSYKAGESVGSPESSITVPADRILIVSSPAPSSGAIGWNVYVSTDSGKDNDRRQNGVGNNDVPLAFGENWKQRTVPQLSGGLFEAWDLSTSHHPMPTYIPYLLTDDPYYLEETQAIGNYAIQYYNITRSVYGVGVVRGTEAREVAWCLRSIVMSALATPDATPSWLLPKSYWQKIIEANRAFLQGFQECRSLAIQVFHACPIINSIEIWQHGYLSFVLGLMKYSGRFPEWDDFYVWQLGGILPTMIDGSGWCKQVPTVYGFTILKKPNTDTIGLINGGHGEYDAVTLKSWKEAYAYWIENTAPKRDQHGHTVDYSRCSGSEIYLLQSGGDYYIIAQGAVNLAVINGIKAARPAKAWMDEAMPILMGPTGYRSSGTAAKWSIG